MNGECCKFVFYRLNSNVSTMVLCYFTTQIQSHTRSLCGGLCGEERVEDLFDNVLADTRTIVMYKNRCLLGYLTKCQTNLRCISFDILAGFLYHGINGVTQQAHDGLAQLFCITIDHQRCLR